jgi:hypothetical protein
MVSSTFGKPAAWKPTPSTCYPPPPPPPLPYDVPCLRGSPGFQLRCRARFTLFQSTTIPFIDHYYYLDGLTTFGSVKGDDAFILSYSDFNFITLTITLVCETQPLGNKRWMQRYSGIVLTPDALPMSFNDAGPNYDIQDESQPNSFNDIRTSFPNTVFTVGRWLGAAQRCQWYTAGAPDWRDPL